MKKKFQDTSNLPEDERIALIVAKLKSLPCGKTVGFFTDSDPGKMERYLSKITAQLPNVIVQNQGDGPVADCRFAILKMPE